jgi:hypothetical protein
MVLPSSGAISLLDIQTEFGGSNPIGIDEYYGVDNGVPSNGQISFADFYGKGISGLIANWKPSSYSGGSTWDDSYTADGTNNYMSKVGSPTYTSGIPSYFTTSNNNHWQVTNRTVGTYSAASIIFWCRQTDSSSIQGGFDTRYGSGTQFGLEFQNSTGRIGYFWNNNASNTYGYDTGLSLTTNVWYMVGLTLDATEVIFYRATSSTISTNTRTFTHTSQTVASNSAQFYGGDPENTARGFKGNLGECWFYNRKLSNSEVTSIFNSTKASYGF